MMCPSSVVPTHEARAEPYLRQIVDNVPALIYLKDLSGRYLLVNRYFKALYRFNPHEMIGRTDEELFRPSAAAVYRSHDRTVVEERRAIEVEEPGWHQDGLYLSIKFPLIGEDGEVAAVGGISTDITERKRNEAIVERARQAAEEANQAKSRLLSRMSHELRTPLTAIIGFSELLAERDLEPEVTADILRINQAAEYLLSLIDGVLEVSRAEHDRERVELAPVHACEPLATAVEMVKPIAGRHDVTVSANLHGALYQFIRVDRQRIVQVLLNVLVNAVKYNRPGGRVEASAEHGDGRLRFLISDTGPGIERRHWERIFQPFERLVGDDDVAGTGLGLALSRTFVEAMGGGIGIESSDESGTTFYVELPLVDPPEDAHVHVFDPQRARARPRASLADARILCVEDNELNIEVLRRLFREFDCELVVRRRAAEALEVARRESLDAIILDLNLPDCSGEELVDRLRRHPDHARTPIVVLTADASPDRAKRMLELGASGYLTKPVDFAELSSALERLISGRDVEGDGKGARE